MAIVEHVFGATVARDKLSSQAVCRLLNRREHEAVMMIEIREGLWSIASLQPKASQNGAVARIITIGNFNQFEAVALGP